MSTWFYYRETGVKPLTLHAKDALFSGRGCKAQRIQFHRRERFIADCFIMDPHKSEFIESYQELFQQNIFIFGVLQTNFILASQCQKLSAIGDQLHFLLLRD